MKAQQLTIEFTGTTCLINGEVAQDFKEPGDSHYGEYGPKYHDADRTVFVKRSKNIAFNHHREDEADVWEGASAAVRKHLAPVLASGKDSEGRSWVAMKYMHGTLGYFLEDKEACWSQIERVFGHNLSDTHSSNWILLDDGETVVVVDYGR